MDPSLKMLVENYGSFSENNPKNIRWIGHIFVPLQKKYAIISNLINSFKNYQNVIMPALGMLYRAVRCKRSLTD